jgi:hypothetical protein
MKRTKCSTIHADLDLPFEETSECDSDYFLKSSEPRLEKLNLRAAIVQFMIQEHRELISSALYKIPCPDMMCRC